MSVLCLHTSAYPAWTGWGVHEHAGHSGGKKEQEAVHLHQLSAYVDLFLL